MITKSFRALKFSVGLRSTRLISSEECIRLEKAHNCQNYGPVPVVIARGQGSHVWDCEGNKFLDCIGAYGAVGHGHSHPKILAAMMEQLPILTLTGRCFYNNKLGPFTKYITELMGYDRCIMMNSGVEGGETAIKFARRWGYASKGIAPNQARVAFAKSNFWGRTIAACASSDDPGRYTDFGPYDLNFDLVDYNDLEALETYFQENPNCCAYMIEPIQGEAGVVIPDDGYLAGVRKLCDKYNVLWIDDEVQSGMGRTGKFLAADHDWVKPDIVILAKSLSAGYYPVSAVLADNKVMDLIKPGDHGSTFGGNPLACVIAKRSIEVLLEEKMMENAEIQGKYLLEGLKRIQPKWITTIRGRGMWLAMESDQDCKVKAKDLTQAMFKHGMLAYHAHKVNVRLSPPLVFSRSECDEMLEKTEKAFKMF